MNLFSLLFLAVNYYFIEPSFGNPIIELPNGKIFGRGDITAKNKTFYAFEKIPYAASPVGNLRFELPQAVQNWNGILNTTHLDVTCYQLTNNHKVPPYKNQSEDCLYLNVFTPKLVNNSKNTLLPVMFFIHGGAFVRGSAASGVVEYYPDLFMNKDVVLVMINYRLGIFGFASTQDEVIPGNYGLKDQLFALQWVNKNIHLFGGDSRKITIFGQSAGAGSVTYLTLNQKTAGLYRGGILESGTCLCPGMFQRNARSILFGVGTTLNGSFATDKNSTNLLAFLKSVTAYDLQIAASDYTSSISHDWDYFLGVESVFAPVIEIPSSHAFLTRKMYGLLKRGEVVSVPIMMGYNSQEKLGSTSDFNVTFVSQMLDKNLQCLTPSDMQITNLEASKKTGSLIRKIYTKGEPFSQHLDDLIRYGSDNYLTRSVTKHAEFISRVSRVFFYEFSYEGQIGPSTQTDADEGYIDGVRHTAELYYLYCGGTSCDDSNLPKADLLTRERLITLWTNFAKYQNPTPKPSKLLQNVTWPSLTNINDDFLYMDIGKNLQIKNHPKWYPYTRWVELYDHLGYDDFDTY